LPKKETKKGPGNNNSIFPVGIPIKLLYYCGEGQRNPDALVFSNFIVMTEYYAWKTKAEITVVQKLNQGTMKGTGCHRSFLDFSLVTFFVSKQRK